MSARSELLRIRAVCPVWQPWGLYSSVMEAEDLEALRCPIELQPVQLGSATRGCCPANRIRLVLPWLFAVPGQCVYPSAAQIRKQNVTPTGKCPHDAPAGAEAEPETHSTYSKGHSGIHF